MTELASDATRNMAAAAQSATEKAGASAFPSKAA